MVEYSIKHQFVSPGSMHQVHNWEYADQATREAASGFESWDLGKLARQTDDNSLWMLIATDPTWVEVSSSYLDTIPDWLFPIDIPPSTPGVVDDEFDSTVLDPSWAVVSGTPGMVSLFATGGGIYDLTSRPGWLLMQVVDDHPVHIYRAFTLPDGYSIMAAVTPCLNCEAQSGIDENDIDVGIILRANGNYITVHLDSEPEGYRVYIGATVDGTPYGYSTPYNMPILPICRKLYFRIARVGLDYYGFWSADGTSWMAGLKVTFPAAMTNLQVWADATEATGPPTAIQAVSWIRVVANEDF